MNTFSDRAIKYFTSLHVPQKLPPKIRILNPYTMNDVANIVRAFYIKFFNDKKTRVFLFGINPGRFGGGLTGIPFTDPVALKDERGINNNLSNQKELSSKFIYSIIKEMGGTKNFYSKYYITALYPLAIIKDGKNYNYYDNQLLYNHLKPQILTSVSKQIIFGAEENFAICLGRKNARYLKEINEELGFFKEIRILGHPRYIMQYRLKFIDKFIAEYIDKLSL